MRRAMRNLLAVVGAGVLVASCGPGEVERYTGAEYVHRWKVTDASGATLSAGCMKSSDGSSSGQDWVPAQQSAFWAQQIQVKASPGSVITDEDNLGTESVQKSRVANRLPTGDAYWCSDADNSGPISAPVVGLDTLHVVDADPPATIVSVTLTNPENDPQAGIVAYGFTLRLRVQHPGVLHLGFSAPPTTTDAGTPSTDAGPSPTYTYAAMTIL